MTSTRLRIQGYALYTRYLWHCDTVSLFDGFSRQFWESWVVLMHIRRGPATMRKKRKPERETTIRADILNDSGPGNCSNFASSSFTSYNLVNTFQNRHCYVCAWGMKSLLSPTTKKLSRFENSLEPIFYYKYILPAPKKKGKPFRTQSKSIFQYLINRLPPIHFSSTSVN